MPSCSGLPRDHPLDVLGRWTKTTRIQLLRVGLFTTITTLAVMGFFAWVGFRLAVGFGAVALAIGVWAMVVFGRAIRREQRSRRSA